MPQAVQGSGYLFQSFLRKKQKRIYTPIPHAKPKADKKLSAFFVLAIFCL